MLPRLYLITDGRGNAGGRIEKRAREAFDGGLKLLQLREKEMATGELYRLAEALRLLAEPYGARIVVNDRVDAALAAGCHGVHLGRRSLPVSTVRALVPRPFLVGVSTHNLEELEEAENDGADFVTFGPVYDTPSKRAYGPPVGLDALRNAVGTAGIPVFGLGGITRDRAGEVLAASAHGVAMISAIWNAPDITRETAAFLAELSRGERL